MILTPRPRWLVPVVLLLPATVAIGFFSFGGYATLLQQSFQTYIPGRITSEPNVFTFNNYLDYFVTTSVYLGFIITSLKLAGISTAIAGVLAYPLAYKIARTNSSRARKLLLTILVTFFFTNSMVKVFALLIVFGDNGLINSILKAMDLGPIRWLGSESAVIFGLVYFLIATSTLALIGPIKNIDPSLEDAAHNLGATKLQTFVRVTLPLSMPGVLSAALLSYALGVSAFIIPSFLGKGTVMMMANVIYARFSSTFNFPAGSAMSIVLLATTLFIAYGLTSILSTRIKGFS
jgi:ABC-type spermidine/putrescine transport system permease subunit I